MSQQIPYDYVSVQTMAQKAIQENPYDSKILPELENYVEVQAKSQMYDFKANRHLLKVYLFTPELIQHEIIVKILLKSLMALPSTDFLACMYMLPAQMHEVDTIEVLSKISRLLETCKFSKFWREVSLGKTRTIIDKVDDFDNNIRQFIAITIASSYRTISIKELLDYLHLPREHLDAYVQAQNWLLDEDPKYVVIPENKDNTTKKKTTPNYTTIHQMSRLLSKYDGD